VAGHIQIFSLNCENIFYTHPVARNINRDYDILSLWNIVNQCLTVCHDSSNISCIAFGAFSGISAFKLWSFLTSFLFVARVESVAVHVILLLCYYPVFVIVTFTMWHGPHRQASIQGTVNICLNISVSFQLGAFLFTIVCYDI